MYLFNFIYNYFHFVRSKLSTNNYLTARYLISTFQVQLLHQQLGKYDNKLLTKLFYRSKMFVPNSNVFLVQFIEGRAQVLLKLFCALWFSVQTNNNDPLEFFLNRADVSLNSANSGNLKINEAWIGLNLKILSLHVSCWHCGSLLVSHTRGGCVVGLSPFTVMTNIFVTEFREFSETFRKKLHCNTIKCWIFFVVKCTRLRLFLNLSVLDIMMPHSWFISSLLAPDTSRVLHSVTKKC